MMSALSTAQRGQNRGQEGMYFGVNLCVDNVCPVRAEYHSVNVLHHHLARNVTVL